jgi:hypothetical protein
LTVKAVIAARGTEEVQDFLLVTALKCESCGSTREAE